MLLNCPKCGDMNALGRVFCANCGAKLETGGITQEKIGKHFRVLWIARHWKKFLAALVAVGAVDVGLAFWPREPLIGERGTRLGGRRVEAHLNALAQIQPGRAMTAVFSEKDINGYIENFKLASLNIGALTVAAKDGCLQVRLARLPKPVRIGSFHVSPRQTYDLLCVPMGSGLMVRKASIGHLPLWGRTKRVAVKAVLDIVTAQPEWANLRQATRIEVAGGSISVHAQK